MTSNLAHPGITPTNLLAAQPGLGRSRDTMGVRLIRVLSRIGLVGTPASAALPAVLAAVGPDSRGSALYGPSGPGHLGGAPAEQPVYSRLTVEADAARIWALSQELTGVDLPA
ncbi:hypothetical protein [Litorihabitans aurantiacus]|uniref:Uncharacterized protein n=1 Tax=Litorihabitans aurantiacus TaxID=1930061 RepID=A0AA37XG91_9MICO|nr:hypothetical protein GCM10025875_30050 [Litorihabitans aurantiacus]